MSVSKKDVHLSKTLSWLLRHGAVKENLEISKEGFAKVTDILNHKNLKDKYTLEDIKRVVATNDKQRFTLRNTDNIWEICANQGHSIKNVDPILVPILEANDIQAIHGTYLKNWAVIKNEGLNRMNRNHIHFAIGLPGDKNVISGMRKTAEVFIYINVPLALSDGIKFFKSANDVILSPGDDRGVIDPKYFLKVCDGKRDEDMDKPVEEDELNPDESDPLVCNWCKIALPNEASMRQHLLGQKHKKLNTVEGDRKRVEQKCGLFIRGYPPNFDQYAIVTYFSRFGRIVWVHFDRTFLLLDYEKPGSAETVINKTHKIGGRTLTVKYREIRKRLPVNTQKKEEPDEFIDELKDIANFDRQYEILVQNLQPAAQQQFPKYNKVCSDLFNILSRVFPYCSIHPFGSTITGLGFRNSDVDVYIAGVKKDNQDVPFLFKLKSLLLNSKLFTNTLVIPQAKIPILKCIHVETGINCDVNLRNMLGVCNSHLINYYLNLDPKLRKVMMILKYWAKTHKITGQNHLFTNYSLILMLIFFLQHDPFRVPPVVALQQNPQFFNFQDGWNGGFQPIPFASSELRHLSILQLLRTFFTFYMDYEFGINVICPFLGVSMKKQSFKEVATLPDCYNNYKDYVVATGQTLKVDAVVCVQDPFEHSRNTTPIVSAVTLEVFVSLCRLGRSLCERSDGSVLYKLLRESPPNVELQTVVKSQSSRFVIAMKPGLKYIEEKYETVSERHREWFKNVAKFTRIVLEGFLKLDLTEVASEPAQKPKHLKTDGQSDVYGNATKVRFKCKGKVNLWQDRKATAKSNKTQDEEGSKKGIVEKELAITEQLCNLYKDISQMDNVIEFEIGLEFFSDSPKVVIDVQKIAAYKKTFKSFVMFLSAKLPNWFRTFEQELNDAA